MAFKYLHGWRLHTFSRKPVPVLVHAHSKKEVFPDVHKEPLLFHFMPIASFCHQKCLTVSLAHIRQIFVHIDEILPCVTYHVRYPCFIYLTCLIVKEDLFMRIPTSILVSLFFFLTHLIV